MQLVRLTYLPKNVLLVDPFPWRGLGREGEGLHEPLPKRRNRQTSCPSGVASLVEVMGGEPAVTYVHHDVPVPLLAKLWGQGLHNLPKSFPRALIVEVTIAACLIPMHQCTTTLNVYGERLNNASCSFLGGGMLGS